MAFRSMEQLRSMIWDSLAEATKELRRNGFKPRGTDYELRETSSGKWMVTDLTDDAAQEAPAAPLKAATSSKKEHPADARARAQIASAASFTIHLRISPSKKFDAKAETIREAVDTAQQLEAAHSKAGRRAMIYAVPADGGDPVPVPAKMIPELLAEAPAPAESKATPPKAEPKAEPEPTPATEPEKPKPVPPAGADLSVIPTDGGPYTVRIDAAHVTQNSAHAYALDVSQKIGQPVSVIGPDGSVVRVIDHRVFRAWQKEQRGAASTVVRAGVPRGPRAPGDSKQGRAILLLRRPQGATAKEINAVTDWPVSQRHINRLAKVSKTTIESMGDKKWRLV